MNTEKRKSGILLHPTSLPSPYGIGDLGENARIFLDKLEEAGQTLWQVLPLCPMGSGNSPYQSSSAFAGNIYLISPDELIACGWLTKEDLGEIPDFSTDRVEYEKVKAYKLPLLEQAYYTFQEKASVTEKREFADFCKKNEDWLSDYVLFTALQDYFKRERAAGGDGETRQAFLQQTTDILTPKEQAAYFDSACWNTWEEDLRKHKKESLEKWQRILQKETEKEKFYQYLFAKEWQAVKAYANKKQIQIMGDAPIFVAYDSADVWAEQELFQLDTKGFPLAVAGVPPDYFSAEGQLWGNPLYDWRMQEKTDFDWWCRRIRKALLDVNLLRIDHFRGFESYWSVGFGAKTAMEGTWQKGPGIGLFHTLQKKLGRLSLIAEDLGIITEEVCRLREEAGLPGMRVLQFAFGEDANHNYLPHTYDKNTVVYTGTHDNDTARGWYESASEEEKDHFRRYMNVSGENVAWDMIRLAFSSPANLAVVPLQDVLNLDSGHRMNIPGIAEGNWGFRFTWEKWEESHTKGLSYLAKLFGRGEI